MDSTVHRFICLVTPKPRKGGSTTRRFILVSLCLASLPLVVTAASGGSDWPQFLGPTRNGVSTETGLLLAWPKNGPPVVWEKEVGDGFSGPVVAGGKLILLHRKGEQDVVECIDTLTGKGI